VSTMTHAAKLVARTHSGVEHANFCPVAMHCVESLNHSYTLNKVDIESHVVQTAWPYCQSLRQPSISSAPLHRTWLERLTTCHQNVITAAANPMHRRPASSVRNAVITATWTWQVPHPKQVQCAFPHAAVHASWDSLLVLGGWLLGGLRVATGARDLGRWVVRPTAEQTPAQGVKQQQSPYVSNRQ
jgi:hypothetical protein